MGIFCLWAVAKPNYYLPCMPGMALLAGDAWVRLCAPGARGGVRARRVGGPRRAPGAVGPPLRRRHVRRDRDPAVDARGRSGRGPRGHRRPWPPPSFVSVRAWRRGADAMALAPIAAALALGVLVVYGILAPAENPRRSHRELARTLARLVPPGRRDRSTFFNEVDEGLWFYLRGPASSGPVPGTQPRYSTAYDLARGLPLPPRCVPESIDLLDARREAVEKQALLRWLDDPESSRRLHADPFRPLRSLRRASWPAASTPVFRETGLNRNELVLLPEPRPHAPRRVRSAHPPVTPPLWVPHRPDPTRPAASTCPDVVDLPRMAESAGDG